MLTAAHCFVSFSYQFKNYSITVVTGTADLSNETYNSLVAIDVEKYYLPEDYFYIDDDKFRIGDVAVAKVTTNFSLYEVMNKY